MSWRNMGLAASSAILLTLAAPPLDLWPLAFVGLVPLYLAVRRLPPLPAAALAGLTGGILLLATTSWWPSVLVRFAHLSWPAGMAVTLGLVAYQAASWACWGGASSFLVRRYGLSWLLVAPLAMVVTETTLAFPFKAHLAITVWRAWPLTQAAEAGGPAAVSALLVLANLVLTESLLAAGQRRRPGRAVALAALVWLLAFAGGLARAAHVAAERGAAPALTVGLVQPNFGVVTPELRERHGHHHVAALGDATRELARRGAELVIWPETAWPYLFDRQLERPYPPGHPWELRPGVERGRLLFGTLSHTFGTAEIYNSAVLVSESGRVAGRHDKARPLPFAESTPFAGSFPGLAERWQERRRDWPEITPGGSLQLLRDGDLRIAAKICSEDLEPRGAGAAAARDANLLVSLASDAWFGAGAAPRQHLALASFRAIETRRDLVRTANTGVSAIVDALGRVRLAGPLIDAAGTEPRPTLLLGEVKLVETPAIGARAAGLLPLACLGAIAGAVVAGRRRRKKRRTPARGLLTVRAAPRSPPATM